MTQSDGTRLDFTWVTGADGVTRIFKVADGLGNKSTFSYDLANRRTTVTDPSGASTLYDYDAQGQLVDVQVPTTGTAYAVTSYTYNANGDLTR